MALPLASPPSSPCVRVCLDKVLICLHVGTKAHTRVAELSSILLNVVLVLVLMLLPDVLLALWHYKEAEASFLLLCSMVLMRRVAMRMTVADYWERELAGRRDREFIVFGDRVLTYAQVEDHANVVSLPGSKTEIFISWNFFRA